MHDATHTNQKIKVVTTDVGLLPQRVIVCTLYRHLSKSIHCERLFCIWRVVTMHLVIVGTDHAIRLSSNSSERRLSLGMLKGMPLRTLVREVALQITQSI